MKYLSLSEIEGLAITIYFIIKTVLKFKLPDSKSSPLFTIIPNKSLYIKNLFSKSMSYEEYQFIIWNKENE